MSVPYYPGSRYTTNLGLSLFGMDEVLAENFVILDSAVAGGGGGGGGGSTVKVNGSTITNPNFNGTTPAAPPGNTNVIWQFDGSGNVSAYILGAAGGPFVQLNPIADQTITGSHQLINLGTEQVGTPFSSFNATVLSSAYDPSTGQVAVSGQSMTGAGIQGLCQGSGAVGGNFVADGDFSAGVFSSTTGHGAQGVVGIATGNGTSGESPIGVFAAAASTTTSGYAVPYGISIFSTYVSKANSIGSAVGILAQAVGLPAAGTTIASVVGNSGRAQNLDAGTVTIATHFDTAGPNINSGGGTITSNYGYNVSGAETVGTTNAAFHNVDQGSGASNYAILSDGGRVFLGKADQTGLVFGGSVSGSATIKVAAAAGTSNPLVLPITTGTAGYVLTTDGANPQQLSWSNMGLGGPYVQLNPTADQTITGAHALTLSDAGSTLVADGFVQFGPLDTTLSAYAQLLTFPGTSFTPFNFTQAGNFTTNPNGAFTLQVINDWGNVGTGAAFFCGVATLSADQLGFTGTSSALCSSGLKLQGHNLSSGIKGGLIIGFQGVTDVQGPGHVGCMVGVLAGGNTVSSGAPTVDVNAAFLAYATKTHATVNALYYGEDQGTAPGDYGLYLAGALGSSNRFGDRNVDDSWSDNQTTVSITRTQSATGQNPIGLQLNVYSPDFAVASYNGIIIESAVAGAVNSTAIATYCDVIIGANNAATVIDQVTGYYQNSAVNGTGTVTLLEGALFTGLFVTAGATVTNAYNIHINKTRSGAGTTVNAHAIHIDDQGTGTNDYALYSEGGRVFLGKADQTGLVLGGSSSGSATIKVATAAGTPNPLVLPITTGAPGQVLTTDGANPQQLSWTTTSSSPSVVATIDATGQSASIATANIVASATAGVYRVSYYMKITTAGSTSGSVTLTLVYTDRDDSTVVTYVVPTPANATDSSSVVSGTLVLDAKVATAITYATTYASVGGTAMVYKLRLKAEKLF